MARVDFRNEDCFNTIENMKQNGEKVDIILTSPPYATSRSNVRTKKALETYNSRYDICLDNMDEDQYVDWTVDLFNHFNEILNENGVILYNISYGSENPNAMWRIPGNIIENTDFMIADCIVWKKKCALPNNVSHNKLTRITEFVYVICRKDEFKSFNANKKISKIGKNGQKYYENVFNFVEAPNNDGPCDLNKATYSSDLCLFLLDIYAKENSIVYDPFMGTGTTAVACHKFNQSPNMVCIGSELSEKQVQYSWDRIKKLKKQMSQSLKIPFEYD